MRITNQWVTNSFINLVNRTNSSLTDLQIKISSAKNYLRASENPSANSIIMQQKVEIGSNNQYIKNTDNVSNWYDNTDSSMTTIESALYRARDLAVRAANETSQEARDAMAMEINELILEISDAANTSITGEYIFSGQEVDQKPINVLDGTTPGYNNSIVTYPTGEVRDKANLNNIINIIYGGNDRRIISEIDAGVTIEKSITANEMLFGDSTISSTPSFTYTLPPLEESLNLDMMNDGKGMQGGVIVITDRNGIDHKVDLSSAHRLDDVIGMINATGSFEAGIEEVPSDTSVALGLYRNAGNSKFLFGLSDPKMLSENTNLSDLNNGLGVPEGYLNINTRDGQNFRVDTAGATTVKDVIDRISAVDGGASLKARYNIVSKSIEIEDMTGGKGEFSITSTKSQMYVRDLPPHVAEDLGIAVNVGASNEIFTQYDVEMQSEESPLSLLNGGKGIERGFINITGHNGVTTQVDLTSVLTPKDIIDKINAAVAANPAAAPGQTASYNVNSNRIVITDNTIGAGDFKIEELQGTAPIAIRENVTVTKNLGLLKSTKGNTVVGDSLITNGAPLDENTLLSDLQPPPENGLMVIRGGDGVPVEINLNAATTIKDVLDKVNETDFKATWDSNENRIVITDPSAIGGNYGMTIEEQSNAGRDLGFVTNTSNHVPDTITGAPIKVKSLPTLTGSIDLNPALTRETDLQDLNSNRTSNTGVNLGYIRITDKAGRFKAIDLRGSKTVGEVLDKINDPINGIYVEARISSDGSGIEIIDKNNGATGKLEVIDIGSTSAADLGISGKTADTIIIGKDVDPAINLSTPIDALRGFNGIPLGKLYIQSGSSSGEVDLTDCKTVGDMMDKLSNSDNGLNMQAWISPDGKKINLTNTAGEPYIKIRDSNDSTTDTASALGLGSSPSIFTTLMDLRDNMLRGDVKAISNESLKYIDEDIDRILNLHAEVGSKSNRVEATREKHKDINLNVTKMLSSVEGIDMVEAVIRMTELEVAYQAALSTGAKLMQTSLLDFLR